MFIAECVEEDLDIPDDLEFEIGMLPLGIVKLGACVLGVDEIDVANESIVLDGFN
jgi:hypothetical protein